MADVSFRGAYYTYYLCTYGFSGWIPASVDLSDGRNIHVEHDRCIHSGDKACSWHVTWT